MSLQWCRGVLWGSISSAWWWWQLLTAAMSLVGDPRNQFTLVLCKLLVLSWWIIMKGVQGSCPFLLDLWVKVLACLERVLNEL